MRATQGHTRKADSGLVGRSISFMLFLTLFAGLSLTFPALASEWQLEKSREGVDFYVRDMADSPIPEFKAITRMEGSVASVLAVLLDVSRYPEWVHHCRQAIRLGSDGPHRQYLYQLNRLPFASDRDIIMRVTLSHRNEGQQVRIDIEAVPEYCKNKSGAACGQIRDGAHVRIREATGSYRIRQLEPDSVEVVWQQHLEPGGRLPGWLVRSQLADIPLKTFSALRQRIKKQEYRQAHLQIQGESLYIVRGEDTAPLGTSFGRATM